MLLYYQFTNCLCLFWILINRSLFHLPFQYSVLISSLAKRAKSIVRDLDPTNELRYLRIRSRKHEVSVGNVGSIPNPQYFESNNVIPWTVNRFTWFPLRNHDSLCFNLGRGLTQHYKRQVLVAPDHDYILIVVQEPNSIEKISAWKNTRKTIWVSAWDYLQSPKIWLVGPGPINR